MEPIGDDERLYRRIPYKPGWVIDGSPRKVKADAFRPHPTNDGTGLSLSRANSPSHPEFLTVDQIAGAGPSAYGYYVAELIAKDLRAEGIKLQEDRLDCDPGHILLPELNTQDRDSNRVRELEELLATKLVIAVHGPFFKSTSDCTAS